MADPTPPTPSTPVIDWSGLLSFFKSVSEKIRTNKTLDNTLFVTQFLLSALYKVSGPVALGLASSLYFQGCDLPLPNKVTVPNLVGLNQAVAIQTISSNNLKLGNVTQVNHDSIPLGNIISQSPTAGTSVAKETAIDLVVSLGRIPTPPPPPPVPAPIVGEGFRVLITFDKDKLTTLSMGQQSILFGKTVRDYLESKCVMGPDGKTKEFRIYPNSTPKDSIDKKWRDAMSRPKNADPWLIVSDGKTGFEGPLPKTVEEAMTILKKYGG